MFFLFFSFSSSCFSFFLILVNLFFYSFICVFLHTLAFSSFHSLFLILSLLHSFSSSSLHPLSSSSLFILSSSSLSSSLHPLSSSPIPPVQCAECGVGGRCGGTHRQTACTHTRPAHTHTRGRPHRTQGGWFVCSFIHSFVCLFVCLFNDWLIDWLKCLSIN